MFAPQLSLLSVCGIDELPQFATRGVSDILSITDPELTTLDLPTLFPQNRVLSLRFHDVIEADVARRLPTISELNEILSFGRRAEKEPHILIHCHLGVSRSTAAMLALLAQRHPEKSADHLFEILRLIRPQAWPNSVMVELADGLLGRNGSLLAALRRHYKIQLIRDPTFSTWMKDLGRQREVSMAV